jgi:hypothetical protein
LENNDSDYSILQLPQQNLVREQKSQRAQFSTEQIVYVPNGDMEIGNTSEIFSIAQSANVLWSSAGGINSDGFPQDRSVIACQEWLVRVHIGSYADGWGEIDSSRVRQKRQTHDRPLLKVYGTDRGWLYGEFDLSINPRTGNHVSCNFVQLLVQ